MAGARGLARRIRAMLDPGESLLDLLSAQELEALLTLAEADEPVPPERLCHIHTDGPRRFAGEWAPPGRAASIVSRLRRLIGRDAIVTVHGMGYVLGNLPEGL